MAGCLLPEIAEKMHLNSNVKVNIGTLDHFAGMIGTGNTAPGGMTLSTGTTMVLTAMTDGKPDPAWDMALHYGFLPDTYIMLPVMESGGVCLDWFRRTCMNNLDYDTLNTEILKAPETDILFLPYLVGTNAPEFDREATGVFFGLPEISIADGFSTSFSPVSNISKTPISFVEPNRFLTALSIRNERFRSPSKYNTASTICSSTFGPAILPSLFT